MDTLVSFGRESILPHMQHRCLYIKPYRRQMSILIKPQCTQYPGPQACMVLTLDCHHWCIEVVDIDISLHWCRGNVEETILRSVHTQTLSWAKRKRGRMRVIQMWILRNLHFPIKPSAKRSSLHQGWTRSWNSFKTINFALNTTPICSHLIFLWTLYASGLTMPFEPNPECTSMINHSNSDVLKIDLFYRLDLPCQSKWNISLHLQGLPGQSWTDFPPLQTTWTNHQASQGSPTLSPSIDIHPKSGLPSSHARWGCHWWCSLCLACFCNF